RLDQERVLRVDVGLADRPLDAVAVDVEAALARVALPDGFQVQIGGELAEQEETFTGLLLGVVLAVFLVFTVMAVQFESLKQPLIVMLSVPFGFVGVALTLVVTGTTF